MFSQNLDGVKCDVAELFSTALCEAVPRCQPLNAINAEYRSSKCVNTEKLTQLFFFSARGPMRGGQPYNNEKIVFVKSQGILFRVWLI